MLEEKSNQPPIACSAHQRALSSFWFSATNTYLDVHRVILDPTADDVPEDAGRRICLDGERVGMGA